MSSIEQRIDEIIEREGKKYTNYPEDKGGPTKFGITQKTLSDWRGTEVTAKDVENLTEAEAREIYAKKFVGDQVSPFTPFPSPIRDFLEDWAVTSGFDDPTRGVQDLVAMYGHALKRDGVFGPKTRQAFEETLAMHGKNVVLSRLIDLRALFYARLAERDATQAKFIVGWLNRTFGFRQH